MNILLDCTYRETEIMFHMYEKLHLKTNMPHVCNLFCYIYIITNFLQNPCFCFAEHHLGNTGLDE
jgi:hypothetical protein